MAVFKTSAVSTGYAALKFIKGLLTQRGMFCKPGRMVRNIVEPETYPVTGPQ